MAYDEALARRIRSLLAPREDVREQKMFGGLTFMVADKMAVGIAGDDLMVRVGRDAYDEALARPHTRPWTSRAAHRAAWSTSPRTVSLPTPTLLAGSRPGWPIPPRERGRRCRYDRAIVVGVDHCTIKALDHRGQGRP
jgi:hypothetical protein